MNKENLHELIKRYEVNFDRINSAEHDEIFKWKVVKCFRDVWFGEAYKELPFAKRFHLATKDSSVLINNSMISPTNGVVKLAEEYPAEVETLFAETLFSGETDPVIVQAQMDRFLEEMERMRQQKFPSYYRYKQERHAASCYLAFFHPEVHYIYRYSEAEEFAKYIEFGKNLGAGADFSLPNYYEMADLVVEALKEHPSLIERHEKFIEDAPKYYRDKSLHLMAFDLMYCIFRSVRAARPHRMVHRFRSERCMAAGGNGAQPPCCFSPYSVIAARFLMESPSILTRCALCTIRSQMASAMVGS